MATLTAAVADQGEIFGFVQGKPDAPTAARGRVGVMARVIESGIVRVGDPVQVIAVDAAQATTSASASGSTDDST
ncbi:MAG: hypothetical protein KJ065_13785 [Anaerolineae bacterium]|nr:hypothetical protein [Anaerolineae bacterium]